MKETALTQKHIDLGAKMVDYAGFNMPVLYTSINEEHHAVRNSVGVFDVSHMGEFLLKGEKALDLLQKISSNDASKLKPGKAQYSYFPNGKGGIVDDFLIYMLAENEYYLVVNASNIEKDWNWINAQNDLGAELQNLSDETSLFAVQGPKATEALQSLTSVDLSTIPYYHFVKGVFAGEKDVLISATGYTGSGGFELYIPNAAANNVWEAIFRAGEKFDIKPIGLGARDTLRLEKGFCLYGNDIDDTTSPLEAGLGWVTKLNKEADFIDKELLTKQKAEGLKRKLIAFEMLERGIPRKDYPILDSVGNVVGIVTSGTQSPSLGKAIGLGYIKTELAAFGTDIKIGIRNKQIAAKIVKPPFV